MKKFDFMEANARKREIGSRLSEIADKISGNDQLTEEVREQLNSESATLREELNVLNMRISAAMANEAAEKVSREQKADKNAVLRELLKSEDANGVRMKREVTLGVLTVGAKNNITSAGAIDLTVKDLMPDLDEGLIWGKVGINVQTNVKGNILWPYATSVVQMEEKGEKAALTDQSINFDNITVVPSRCGATIAISNEAIDDASFDLMGYVQKAITLAQQRYLNWKTFSHDNALTGMKGPWASKAGSIATLEATYANILSAKADLIDAGVEMRNFAWVVDASAEALLKSTPKADGQGGFIIQNGTLDGDPYFVSHYIRQTSAKAKAADMYIGLGAWNYLAANQHGEVRLVIDPYTKAVNNETVITLNTKWSLTTLRDSAFAIYKLTAASDSSTAANPE